MLDWSHYPNFTADEFDCSHTGLNDMKPEFMSLLQQLRTRYGRPMVITSGYRDATHPIEARKRQPGQHSKGLAADIACWSTDAYLIAQMAFEMGFSGIGVSQRGQDNRFIHLDLRPGPPVLYSY